VPIDPINIDAVEISRGPNSNIFGLGQGSGTVNIGRGYRQLQPVDQHGRAALRRHWRLPCFA
jgi:outer membrane receptor protein involved in Fe transport